MSCRTMVEVKEKQRKFKLCNEDKIVAVLSMIGTLLLRHLAMYPLASILYTQTECCLSSTLKFATSRK